MIYSFACIRISVETFEKNFENINKNIEEYKYPLPVMIYI